MTESIPTPLIYDEIMGKLLAYKEMIMLKGVDIINQGGDAIYIGKEIPGRDDVVNVGITHLQNIPSLLEDIQNWVNLNMSKRLQASFETIDGALYIVISGLQSTKG